MPNNFEQIARDYVDELDFDSPTIDLRNRLCRYYDPMRYKYEFRQMDLQVVVPDPVTGVIPVFAQGAARFSPQGLISLYISHIDKSSTSLIQFPSPPQMNFAFGLGENNAGDTLPPDPATFGGTGVYSYVVPSWKGFGHLVTFSGRAFTQLSIWASVSAFTGPPAIAASPIKISLAMVSLPDPGAGRLTIDQGAFYIAP